MPRERTYTDIDFDLTLNATTQDIYKVYDLNAVKQSVKNLVLTNFYGRPFHPEIGSSIRGLLFENWSPIVEFAMKENIKAVIDSFEPRADVVDVRCSFDDKSNTLYVEVDLYLYALMQEATVDFVLERAR